MPKNEPLRDSKKLTWLFQNGVGLDNPRTPRDSSNICSMILFILLVSSSDVNFQLFQRSNTSYERQWTDPSKLSNYPKSVRRVLILTWSNENGRIMTLFLSFCFFVLFLFFLTKFSRIPSWKSWIRGRVTHGSGQAHTSKHFLSRHFWHLCLSVVLIKSQLLLPNRHIYSVFVKTERLKNPLQPSHDWTSQGFHFV